MQVNLREIVLDILLELEDSEAMSHVVINNALTKYQYLDKNQRNFISRTALGTIERKIELDYIINSFSSVKANKQKKIIRCILRMSVYQMKYMDSVPDSAVCSEAVKLASKRGFSGLKGFVNGVLRNISRGIESVEYPDESKNLKEYLQIKYSCPLWLIDYWEASYGIEKTQDILKGFEKEKKTYIRCNTNKIQPSQLKERLTSQGITVSEISGYKELDYAFEISGYNYLLDIDEFAQGMFYVQDISSMLAAEGNVIDKTAVVVDVCAAPGGKTFNAALKAVDGRVYSRDVSEYKVGLIEENLSRLELDNVFCSVSDALVFDEQLKEKADVVIADLPCSGLGIIGRKPDIKYNMTREKLEELSILQRRILSVVTGYVKPGGVLIYSTCTINKCENEDNAEWITKEFPFEYVDSPVQLIPDERNSDGFFIARLRRK